MAVEIKIIGGVDAYVDGRPLALGGSKQRAVLAMLALRANRIVAMDELIDGLWGDRPPASAAKNVQLYVSRLRKALGAEGSAVEARIATRGRGYELQLAEDAVDAARFEHLVERARREAERGAAPNGAAHTALELWRGAPLADVAEEPFAGPEIRRLDELYLHTIELDIDAELAAGRHAEVLGRLEALIAEYPLREHFLSQRMLALYRAGRQSEAIEAYREAHRALVAEIGAEPGPELRNLQDAILRQDPFLDARPPTLELPRQLEGGSPLLAGRDHELRWLRKRWREAEAGSSRLALVSGPGGIGKTRLVAELAAEVQRAGAEVLYAAGSGAPDAALRVIAAAVESELPTLVVLDDANDASPAVLEAAAALEAKHRDTPLLLLVLHRDEQGPPAFADAVQRLALRPLRVEAAAEIAELYARAEGVAMPLETLMVESEGVPLRVHRAASEWAQAQAAEQLEAAAGKAAINQGGLRTARAKVAGGVADLQVARERTSLYAVTEPPDPTEAEICPFRGLAPFDSAHAEFFFGRERLVADLVARLVGSALIAVVGPSGSGKSSVIRAGLLPSLADGVLPGSERWRQVLMRPGEWPREELGRALARAGGATQADGHDPLAAALGSLRADERVVLAVDQFEEIFTACRDEDERTAFTEALTALADDTDQRVVVVLGVRGDFYGRCAEYPELGARISANTVLVGPMRRDELRRAIELPAKRVGLRMEPQLVSALLGDVAEEPGGLPLLSTTLVELWEERSGRTLRRSSYERSGGVSAAVARLAERAYQRLSQLQRERARVILLRLTDAEQPAPVRRRVPLAELETDRDEDGAVALAVLTESRLVTVDEGTVEVAHEALLREWPRLRAWLEDDIEGRRLHQHLIHAAAEWESAGRDPAELYRGARLGSALDWAVAHDPDLNVLEREFLEASKESSEREAERQRRVNRRLRSLLAGVGVLLAAAVFGGVIAISQRQSAREAATSEAAQRLATEALNEGRLDIALRLANAGVALDHSLATRSSLLSVLLRSPETLRIMNGGGEELDALALSPDGRTLAVGDTSGQVFLFDAETGRWIGEHTTAGREVTALDFDPDGQRLAIAGREPPNGWTGYLEVIDAETQELRHSIALGRHPASAGGGEAPGPGQRLGCLERGPKCLSYYPTAAWSPDGRELIVGFPGDPGAGIPMFLRRFAVAAGKPLGRAVRIAPRSSGFAGVHPTPDGRLLYPGNHATYAVDAETLEVVRRYPVGGFKGGVSADGRTLALGSRDGTTRLLDLRSGNIRRVPGRHEAAVVSFAFSPDGRTLASGGEDGSLILRTLTRDGAIELSGHEGGVFSQAFSPDGAILYTVSTDTTARAWDLTGDRRLAHPFRTGMAQIPEEGFPPSFDVSPDGLTLAIARFDGSVELIDTQTLRRTDTFKAFDSTPATAIEYSPDGSLLAVAGGRGLLGLWDAASGRRLGPLLDAPRTGPCADPASMFEIPSCHDRTIQDALAFASDEQLAAVSVGGEARIWDLDQRRLVRAPLRVPPFAIGLDFSPDGSTLAVPFGLADPNHHGVEVRDRETGEQVAELQTENEVRTVAFAPDGSLLAAGQIDGRVQLWETDGWKEAGTLVDPGGGSVLSVEFSPDGRTIATSSENGTVVLWDVEAQEPTGPPLPPLADWLTAQFSPEGGHLFAVNDSGEALRFEVDPAAWRQHACAVAGGGLTPQQWDEIVPEQDYVDACPE